MKTNKHGQFKGFLLGVVTTVMVIGLAVPAMADTVMRDIRVAYGGISIYIDGDLQHPVDGAGRTVEPMIYDGTTYLPVRALTNMLTDKPGNWDGNTRAVYIGTMPKKANVGLEEISLLRTGEPTSWVKTGKDAQFKVLEKTYTPNNAIFGGYDTFLLNSEYKELHAYFTRHNFNLGSTTTGTVEFYNVDSHGTKTLLKEYTATPGDNAIEVSVDLMGVNYLYIESDSNYNALYDVYLTPAN